MKKHTITLTEAERSQLEYYIIVRQRDNWYYGNREQFEKREERLLKKLKATNSD
jgi:hypothetical protein